MKTLNHKSKPSTSTSSALPAYHIYFFSKYPHLSGNLSQKKKQRKNTLHSIAFLFCFNLFQILQFFMFKIMEKWYGMRSQDVVLKWSCMTTKYVFWSLFFHPKQRNCPHQIDPFPARNNPSNVCLCILPQALLSGNRVSPLNENLFQSTHRQMKWRLAHCT